MNLKDFEKIGIEFNPNSKSGYSKLKSKHSGIMDLHVEYKQNKNKTSDLIVKMWHETSDGLKDPLVIMGVNYHATKNEEVYYLEWHDENMNYHTTDEAEMKDFVENVWFPNLINNQYHFDNWYDDFKKYHIRRRFKPQLLLSEQIPTMNRKELLETHKYLNDRYVQDQWTDDDELAWDLLVPRLLEKK